MLVLVLFWARLVRSSPQRAPELNSGLCRRRGDGGSRGNESDSSFDIAGDEGPDAANRARHVEHEVPFVSLNLLPEALNGI